MEIYILPLLIIAGVILFVLLMVLLLGFVAISSLGYFQKDNEDNF